MAPKTQSFPKPFTQDGLGRGPDSIKDHAHHRPASRKTSCGSLRDSKRCSDDLEVDQLLRVGKRSRSLSSPVRQSKRVTAAVSKSPRARGVSRKSRVKQARLVLKRRMAQVIMSMGKSPTQLIYDLRTNLALAKHDCKQQTTVAKNSQAQFNSVRNDLEAVKLELDCPICKDTLVRPSALVPCGHVYCESCLLGVFTTPLPDELPETMHWERPKNCPDCRSPVHHAPVLIHFAKSIISRLHPDVDQSAPPRFGLPAGFDTNGSNTWEKIFPTGFEFDDVDDNDEDSDSAVEIEDYLPDGSSRHIHRHRFLAAHSEERQRRMDDRMLLESQDRLNQLSLNLRDGGNRRRAESDRIRNLLRLLRPDAMEGTRPAPIVISDDEELPAGTDASSSSMEEDSSDEEEGSVIGFHSILQDYRMRHSGETGQGFFCEQVHSEPFNFVAENGTWQPDVRRLAARGVPPAMQHHYNVKYSHSRGIYIEHPPGLIFYVGWNINLLPEDENGEVYMSYLRWELENHPERWKSANNGRVRGVKRLTWVPRTTSRSRPRRRA